MNGDIITIKDKNLIVGNNPIIPFIEGDENFNEVKRHLRTIAKNKSIHKHILLGNLNLNQTLWPDGQTNCALQNKFVDLFHELDY